MTWLMIGNLSLNTSEKALEDVLSRAGKVETTRLALDPRSGRQRGFAFVRMSNSVEAEQAVKLLNGADLDGRSIVVNRSPAGKESSNDGLIKKCLRFLSG